LKASLSSSKLHVHEHGGTVDLGSAELECCSCITSDILHLVPESRVNCPQYCVYYNNYQNCWCPTVEEIVNIVPELKKESDKDRSTTAGTWKKLADLLKDWRGSEEEYKPEL